MNKIIKPGTNINIPGSGGFKKILLTLAVFNALSWNPEANAANLADNTNSQLLNDGKHRIEIWLQAALTDDKTTFKYWNESQEDVGNIENKEEKAINFIHKNFSINEEPASNLTVERIWDDEYSIDYPIKLQWDTVNSLLRVVVKCNYSETDVSFDRNLKYYFVTEKSGNTIIYDETMGQAKLNDLAEHFKINGVYVNGKVINGVKKYVKVTAIWNKIYFEYDDDFYVYEKDWDSNEYNLIEKMDNVDNKRGKAWFWSNFDFAVSSSNPYKDHISIKENPYKDENIVKDVIAKYSLKYKDSFKDSYPEILWNVGLSKLNTPDLLEHIFEEEDWSYYRELCYKYGNEYIKIMNVYFDKTGKIDIEKTNNSMKDFGIFKKWDCGINENWFFYFEDDAVKELVEKVIKNRATAVQTMSKNVVMSVNHYPKLKNVTIGDYHGPDPRKVISYNPIRNIYYYNLNDQEPIPCTINENGPTICDPYGNPTGERFYKFQKPFHVTIKNWGFVEEMIDKPGKNPQKILPKYSGDKNVSSLLNDSWTSVRIDPNGGVSYYKDWKFIWKIPCKKNDDNTWEMLENYSTNIDIMDLYNDKSFDVVKREILDWCKKLWITEIDLINIFEKSLKNKGLSFNSKNVSIINDGLKYWIYYTISNGFNISIDNNVYNIVKESFDEMRSRLEYLYGIDNCKVFRVCWKEKEDIHDIIWVSSNDFLSESAVLKFISWDNDEIERKLLLTDWQQVVINYSVADGNKLKWFFTWGWNVCIWNQSCSTSIDRDWNVIFTAKAGKRINK